MGSGASVSPKAQSDWDALDSLDHRLMDDAVMEKESGMQKVSHDMNMQHMHVNEPIIQERCFRSVRDKHARRMIVDGTRESESRVVAKGSGYMNNDMSKPFIRKTLAQHIAARDREIIDEGMRRMGIDIDMHDRAFAPQLLDDIKHRVMEGGKWFAAKIYATAKASARAIPFRKKPPQHIPSSLRVLP
eukprot:TRINITY_DN39110_c0_g1_i1.p1 TRINITY_DN39110_c0_g1~~TRINITY_DN39110_c0_g1_i1.p1  ORF type:complete len:188 (-),score=27.65 TRINITY_DN39110_c0_g1_i1:132-695(-)